MVAPRKNSLTFKTFKMVESILLKCFGFFSYLNICNTINYFGVDEEDKSIFLKLNGIMRLYGIKLEAKSNKTVKLLNFSSFRQEFRNMLDADVDLMISIVKHNNTEAIYVFSSNKLIIESLSKNLEIKTMSAYEILTALYHVFLLNVYEIKNMRPINRYTDEQHTQPVDLLFKQFPSLISIASDNILQEYTPYQITGIKNVDTFSIIDLFRNRWEGVCHLYMDLSTNKIKNRLEFLYKESKSGDIRYKKAWEQITDAGETKVLDYLENHCLVFNGMFYLKDKAYASSFQDTLGVFAEERFLSVDKILPRTLLLTRDIDFDIIVDENKAGKYFATSLCGDCVKTMKDTGAVHIKPDFFGLDINGNFFNYMFKNNPSPHGLIFGTTGAGKSVAAIKIVCHIAGYDFEKKVARDISYDRKIRYLNVGYTGGELFQNIKNTTPEKIEIISSTINNLRFSLFDFDDPKKPTEEEKIIFVNFIDLMLDVSSKDANRQLSGNERAALQDALVATLEKSNPADIELYELTLKDDAYKEIVNKILSEHEYKDGEHTKVSDLLEPYRSYFFRYTLVDLYNQIKKLIQDTNKTPEEQRIFDNLYAKLKLVVENPLFAYYPNIDVSENKPIYYADFDKISEDKANFVAIGWLLISAWYRKDKLYSLTKTNARQRRPDSFYFIEEAHKFLGIPAFAALVKTFAKEVRKFGIHLILITQDVGDVDEEVRDLFSTSAFLFKEEARAVAYEQIKKVNAGKDLDPAALEVFNAIKSDPNDENRTLFLKHSNGVNAFTLPAYSKYSSLFLPLDLDLLKQSQTQ